MKLDFIKIINIKTKSNLKEFQLDKTNFSDKLFISLLNSIRKSNWFKITKSTYLY
jgi:hypothetical protein